MDDFLEDDMSVAQVEQEAAEMDHMESIVDSRVAMGKLLRDNQAAVPSHEWCAPADMGVLTRTMWDFSAPLKSLQYLLDLHRVVADSMMDDSTDECLVRLDSVRYPLEMPVCPALDVIESRIGGEALFLTVYSLEGYNFTAEFNNVYRGKTTWTTAYADIQTILARAIQTNEPTLGSGTCANFASYVLQMVGWETRISYLAAVETLKAQLPELNASAHERIQLHHAKVYVGRSEEDDSLCFWLRLNAPIKMTADLGTEDMESVVVAQAVRLVYYRRFPLTETAVANHLERVRADEADRDPRNKSGKGRGGPPAPPPKPPSQRDVRLHVLVGKLAAAARGGGSVAEADELDEDDIRQSRRYLSQMGVEMDGDDDTATTITGVTGASDGVSKLSYGGVASIAGAQPTAASEVSHCAELVGWGHNTMHSLGLAKDDVFEPRPVPVPASLSLEKVRFIACSPRHSVILTDMGNLFSCGENSEGALGLGDTVSRCAFTLIPLPKVLVPSARVTPGEGEGDAGSTTDETASFKTASRPPRFVKVAAGASEIGSHTVAVDERGQMYAWGAPYACGFGHTKPTLVPAQVTTFPLEEGPERPSEDENEPVPLVADVACGGGFTLVIMRSGRVASMGVWNHGRLGHGPTPHTLQRGKKRLARYQLRPRYIKGIRKATAVACGEAHSVCVANGGQILSWGQNSCGQLGVGVTTSGFLRDCFRPALVEPFALPGSVLSDKAKPRAYMQVQAKRVFCGSYHSGAIDADGAVWTWGARGSDCLGHYDCQLEGEWSKRFSAVFTASTNLTKVMVPYELVAWCEVWARPRPIKGLDIKAVDAVAGDMHTLVLSDQGQTFLCGTGPVVPAFVPGSALDALGDDADAGPDLERMVKVQPTIVATPRCPSASWLNGVSPRKVLLVASSGTRCFAVHDTEIIADSMRGILKRTMHGPGTESSDAVGGGDAGTEDGSLNTHYTHDSRGSILQRRGKVDCMILASGRVLLAHRALLAHRSPVLRDMLIEEAAPDEDLGEPTQILLPELHADVARALVYYLYTDILPVFASTSVSILRSLVRAGQNLRIPRLEIVSKRILHVLTVAERSHSAAAGDKPVGKSIHDFGLELPPATLAKDLGSMVGDPQYADVRFFAEGKAVYAHRFILEARCGYFRAMFRSGMLETDSHGVCDVIVPDSFVGFLRFVIYCYTNTLPDGSDVALLEDLLSADRYGLSDMTMLCESMLCPTLDNWLDLLRTADMVRSVRLRAEVEGFVRDNLSALKGGGVVGAPTGSSPLFEAVKVEFPDLVTHIMMERTRAYPLPPSQALIKQTMNNREGVQEGKPVEFDFPWQVMVVAVVGWGIFHFTSQEIKLGPFLPFINAVGIVLMLYYGFFRDNED